jgi:hypothetical protein
MTIIRSMYAKSANHMPAVAQMNTGFILTGFPSMGAWVTYGLGTENQNLPAFVVLPDPYSYPWGGTLQWSNGFLPSNYQGVMFRRKSDLERTDQIAAEGDERGPSQASRIGWRA